MADKRLRDIVIPVLKDGWPGLKRIEVRGVDVQVLMELENLGDVEVIFGV